ncbi:glycosyltransferase [Geodermatophilus sp. SYSU D00698]
MPFPPSVLVIVDTLDDNGGLRWIHELSRHWLAADRDVNYLSLKFDVAGRRATPPDGATLTYADTKVRRFRKALPGALLHALQAVAASDVVLVISEVAKSLPLGYALARLTRRPFVVYVQSIPDHAQGLYLSRRQRRLWHFCMAHADAVLCVSPASAESTKQTGVAPTRITVAPAGIDVDAARRRSTERVDRAPRTTEQPLVACGELQPHKGFDILIRALAMVHETGRRVGLVIMGRGPEESALRSLADSLGVGHAVTFTGHVENPLPEMARGAAFVHAARVEAVGLVLLEALALGVPTIAADCASGGPRMVLGGGEYGRLVEPESVPAMAEAICAHLDAPGQLARQAAHAEPHLRELFSAADTAAVVLDVLSRVSKSSTRTPRDRVASTERLRSVLRRTG